MKDKKVVVVEDEQTSIELIRQLNKELHAAAVITAINEITRQNGQFGPEDVMGLCDEFKISENEFYEILENEK